MAMDAISGTSDTYMFGGLDANGNSLNDTWHWNGSTWTPVTTTGNPGNRSSMRMVYDPALSSPQFVLFGGINCVASVCSRTDSVTWLFDPATSIWSQCGTCSPPPNSPTGTVALAEVSS
jgi:hypothetical protein